MRWLSRANRFGLWAFTLAAVPSVASNVRAAELSVDAPASCVEPSALADEVSDLIGKPIASVADVDFRVQISEGPRRRWRLRLEMVGRRPNDDGTTAIRGNREIEGATCAELAEAAAVAIAVSVRSMMPEASAAGPRRPTASEEATPAPNVTAPPAPPSPGGSPRQAVPWRPAVALALATETGALPNTGFGVDVEAALRRGGLQVLAFGTWFASQDTIGAGNTGGRFRLVLGGGLACFAPQRGRWTGLACAGFELGRLAGTGISVARPATGALFWRAPRADLGVTVALGGSAALIVRAGAAVPLSRPEFVLDGADLVYRPSRLAGRLTTGLVIEF